MISKVITDNSSERITVKWDGERFGIIAEKKDGYSVTFIVLNPREMLDVVQFASNLGGEKC